MPSGVRIFICHAREDLATAREFCEALEDAGLSCWMAARDVPAGASRSRAITSALGASDAMLVVVSSQTGRTKKVVQEVERAAKRGMTLVPVRIEQITPQGDLERVLSAADYIDAPVGPTPAIINRVVAAVSVSPEIPSEPQPDQPIRDVPEWDPEPAPAASHLTETSREPEPDFVPPPTLPEALIAQEAAQLPQRDSPPARVRPPRPVPQVPQPADNEKPAAAKYAGIAIAVAAVVVLWSLFSGGADEKATPAPAVPVIEAKSFEADAAAVAAAIPALEARAVEGPPTRAVRDGIAACGTERQIPSVQTVSFVDDGVEWTVNLVLEERCVVFTAVSSNTVAYVAEVTYPSRQLLLRTVLSGTPPSVPMRPLDTAAAEAAYGQMLARWAAYVRGFGNP